MRSIGELKTMIKCFRVVELHSLLAFAGRNVSGKKQELQDRALELLKLNSLPVYLEIQYLFESMQKAFNKNKVSMPSNVSQSSDSTTDVDENAASAEKEDDSISIVDDKSNEEKVSFPTKRKSSRRKDVQVCSLQSESSLQSNPNPLCIPVHPDVRFKNLPFYKVLYELLKPSSLIPQNCFDHQENSFMVFLTPQQAASVCISKDMRLGRPEDFNVQVQLRFCLLETTSEQEDCFPAGLVVKVNNKYCQTQEPSHKKKKDNIYVKESCPPVNITPLMRISPVGNRIDVQWDTEYGRAYAAAVYLVQKKSSEDLLNRLKAKGIRSADYTRGMIKDKLNEEADEEILTTSLRVSLMCPLGKMRLKNPCRASTCQHLQCFDASMYLQLNEKKSSWVCPVCDSPAEYDNLVIDGYFLEILSSDALLPEVNEIELHRDGTWSSLAVQSEETSTSTLSKIVKIEEVEDIIEEKVKIVTVPKGETIVEESGCVEVESVGRCETIVAEKRKLDEIDLTISDSDDEPLIWYKRREMLKNKRNEMVHSNTNSVRSSPALITLDSDSSDSLSLVSGSISETPSRLITTDLEDTIMPKSRRLMSCFPEESAVYF